MATDDGKNQRSTGTDVTEDAAATRMEIWRTHLQKRYRHDAEHAIQHALIGEPDRVFVERILELLRTYVEVPGVGLQPQLADEKMLRLAQLTAAPIRRRGYWREMNYLWPKLCAIAETTGNADLYIIFVKFMAMAKGYVGEWEAGLAIYDQLMQHPRFQSATATLQANVLITHATALVWRGRPTLAEPVLQRCLTLTEVDIPSTVDGRGTSSAKQSIEVGDTPLWETRAYALNQSGVLRMFSGEFAAAHQYFAEMYALFQAHGEENNLACIAHQAIGRLTLYEKNYSEALVLLVQGYPIRKRWNDREGIAVNAIYMAAAQIGLRQFDLAHSLLDEALAICRSLDNQHDLALCHLYLGLLAWHRHQSDRACDHWQETITIADKAVLHFVEVQMLMPLLPTLFCRGQLTLAWQLLKMLWQSARNDQLALHSLWRFLWPKQSRLENN